MLTDYSDVVLFSAAIPNRGGDYHVNEQWQEYWAGLFRSHDFVPVDFRHLIWKDERGFWWYAQNTLLYVHKNRLRSILC
jgi:hypothetical protein